MKISYDKLTEVWSGLKFNRAVWAMPLVYAMHIPEEFFAGFPHWVTHYMHGHMGDPKFCIANSLFMTILISLCYWASRSRSMLAAFAVMSWGSGNLFWNFVFHLSTTVIFNSYSPGLVTATFFYFPVSVGVSLLALREQRLSFSQLLKAFFVGACLMLFVIWAGLWEFHIP